LEHAAIAPERIEDAGQAAGERDDGDVLAALYVTYDLAPSRSS
jgi:hypothetical protein